MKTRLKTSLKIAAGILVAGQLAFFQNLSAQDGTVSAKAGITLSFNTEDSVKQVKATVTKVDAEGKVVPAPDVEMNIYAKKSFGLLPLGDPQTTDENGEITVEFPNDLPGDTLGNITVVAKFEDNEELGTMETSKSVKWGIPIIPEEAYFHKRALWASGSNAPLPLVITVTSMVVGAWAVIIYIIVLLTQIKKSANYEIKDQN